MSYAVKFTPKALTDYNEIKLWYEEQSEIVRQHFEQAVKERLNFASEYPEASPIQHSHIRGILLKKFKYKIYYRVDDIRQFIVITPILHTSRDSGIGKKRL
jgi:plasmid stabilization system protein ParE